MQFTTLKVTYKKKMCSFLKKIFWRKIPLRLILVHLTYRYYFAHNINLCNNFAIIAVKMEFLHKHTNIHTCIHAHASRKWVKMINVYIICVVPNFQISEHNKCTHHECHPKNSSFGCFCFCSCCQFQKTLTTCMQINSCR